MSYLFGSANGRSGDAFWEEESSRGNVGVSLMQKMGWDKGKGLGKDGSGSRSQVVSGKRNNSGLGLGAKKPDFKDNWIVAQNLFNGVLSKLKPIQNGESTQPVLNDEEEEQGESACVTIQKYSARNQLYVKFKKSKDVSTYSSKDLAEIFGRRVEKEKECSDSEDETAPSKSMYDYFNSVRSSNSKDMQDHVFSMYSQTQTRGRRGLGMNNNSDEDDDKDVIQQSAHVVSKSTTEPKESKKSKRIKKEKDEEKKRSKEEKKARKELKRKRKELRELEKAKRKESKKKKKVESIHCEWL